jgi:Fe-S oxidoreductase
MKIGIIDVDGHNFPNLPLMKLSAWHKARGDTVQWYEPLLTGHCDKVYMSKVFTFTEDYPYYIDADEIVKSGTGYFYPNGGAVLQSEVEHIYPDYSIYPQYANTAYGFLTRGCPRNCDFCIVGKKEGIYSRKVANLNEFWKGQKEIKLLDPNITACKDWRELFQQLIDSQAWIDFTQGLDIRLITKEKAEMLKKMKVKQIHFAWDNYKDKDKIIPKFKEFKEITGWNNRKLGVYVLTNFNSNFEQDLERIYTLRTLGYDPYIMIYEKDKLPSRHKTKQLQRWVNNRRVWRTVEFFEDFDIKKA